jgi:hypothetical protein
MKVGTIRLGSADGYALTQFGLVKAALKAAGKYQPDLLYRGIDGNNIQLLLASGQDTPSVDLFCATEEQITADSPTQGLDHNPFDYAFDHERPALAVFDPAFLQEVTFSTYRFKNPERKLEALVVVYRLSR